MDVEVAGSSPVIRPNFIQVIEATDPVVSINFEYSKSLPSCEQGKVRVTVSGLV